MAAEEDGISCAVCNEIYSDPRCFPCGHSFCLKCITGLADKGKKFTCPICQSTVDLKDGQVDDLPKNFGISTVIEAKDWKQSSMCLKHQKLLDIYCDECNILICSKCLLLHKSHNLVDVDDIFIKRNNEIAEFLDSTKLWASQIEVKKGIVEQSRYDLQRNVDSIQKSVDIIFKKWYDALHVQQQNILSCINEETDTRMKMYDEAERVLMSSMTEVTELENEIKRIQRQIKATVVQQYSSINARREDCEREVLREIESCFEKPDDLKIEVCAPWIEEAIANIIIIDMKQTQACPQTQKISEIQEENTIQKRETRRLKVENQYLKWILDNLHTNIIVGEATPQKELKLPEELKNDQSLIELTTDIMKVARKFYDLETELDYIHRRISKLSCMIVGGEESEATPSPERTNKFTAMGRKPRSNPTDTTKQSERSLKLDKDLELVTSAWNNMKERFENECVMLQYATANTTTEIKLQEELSSKEVRIIQLEDKTNRQIEGQKKVHLEGQPKIRKIEGQKKVHLEGHPKIRNILTTQSQLTDIETREEVAEKKLRALKDINIKIDEKWVTAENALVQKKEEYSKLEMDKKELEKRHEELKQIYRDICNEKETLEGLKITLRSDVSRLRHDVARLQEREINLENYYKQQIEARSSTIENQVQKIKQLHEEKNGLLTRLSKLAGDRLTHENVNIADLSNSDRPTKLSETFSELYDNEWTDAFEELTSKHLLPDEKAIEFLLVILLNAFQKCREITWDRYEVMKSVAVTLDIMHSISSSSQNKSLERNKVLNPEESKSDYSPKDPGEVNQPPSSPSEERVTAIQVPVSNHENKSMRTHQKNRSQQEQQSPVEPMETDENQNNRSGESAPQAPESNQESNMTSGFVDLNQAGEKDVSRLSSATTSGQSCLKDKGKADFVAEDEKDSRVRATLHLSLSVDQEKEIKTAWKKMSSAIQTQALELLRSVLKTGLGINDKDMPYVSRYLISCMKICWKMGVQEKPLHLDVEAERAEGPKRMFDTDKFRAYTKTGTKVAYVVWPALFLHEGGGMLTKGIAQGC